MSLNIKNERVHELAREAARRTGKSQTLAIQEALERYLADLRQPSIADKRHRMQAALADFDTLFTAEDRTAIVEAAASLYDDRGLPA